MSKRSEKIRRDIIVDGRRYHDTRGLYTGRWEACEHCDAERGDYVRKDRLRGQVCPQCDASLDEMLGEIGGSL